MAVRSIADRYVLDQKPRRGGSAAVYHAYDHQNNMLGVAVKVFETRWKNERTLREVFNRELEALSRIDHPNVIKLLDWGLDDGEGNPYVVLEWADSDLLDVVQERRYEGWDSFAEVAICILKGIAAIQDAGFIHRDIKPENVLIGVNGTPKIADLGISKLVARLNMSMTLESQRTEPYAPPDDEQDPLYGFTRDVFSFGVLVTRVLIGKHLSTYAEVREAVEELDVPPQVHALIRRMVSRRPAERPKTAAEALGEVERIQSAREAKWVRSLHLYLSLTARVKELVIHQLVMDQAEVLEYVLEDLRESASFSIADPGTDSRGIFRDTDLLIAGSWFSYRLRPDAAHPGVLAIIGATKLPPSLLETQRARGWRGPIEFKKAPPLDSIAAAKDIEQLLIVLAEHGQQRTLQDAEERQREIFRSWRSVLEAKWEVEESRSASIGYSRLRIQRNRVVFDVVGPLPADIIGQPRVVRVPGGRSVAGEVDDVSPGQLVLFLQRGNPADLPPSGTIIFDAYAARIAIERQRGALDAIRFGRGARQDLASLLLNPAGARVPDPVQVETFRQAGLDDSKQHAVEAALGAPDFVVVQGPPGTGKTTLIAELVAQFLEHNPEGRVLVASQTHVALDNALERIRLLCPSRRLLRIGRSERIGPEVESLTLENQMEAWRGEVLSESRQFLRAYAEIRGVKLAETDVMEVAARLRAVRKSIHDLRSRIQRRDVERRQLAADLARLTASAPQIVELNEQLNSAASQGTSAALRHAVDAYLKEALRLAEGLDVGGALRERLLEFESSLAEWRTELQDLLKQDVDMRVALTRGLGLPTEEPPPNAEQLLELAEGHRSQSDPTLARLQDLYVEYEQRFGRSSDFNGALMASADVVAATCVGLAGVRGTLDVDFDLCILDEASKATATEALVPISRGKRWVLVGDPYQLPPFQEDALADHALLEKHGLTTEDVDRTLFDLLTDHLPPECSFALLEQHRMVPAIGEFISQIFYGGRLSSKAREPKRAVAAALDRPIVWLSTVGLRSHGEHRAGTSFSNVLEANALKVLLERLDFCATAAKERVTVAVLTGYTAQREQIGRTLANVRRNHLDIVVSTVDAFQGREADVSIFSVTRSNNRGDLGFLTSKRRINVALSRGRDALVIVGDDAFVRSSRRGETVLIDVLHYMERVKEDCTVEEARL